MSDYLSEESKAYFEKVKAYLNEVDIPYEIDERLVRGLDYYTDTVYEVVSTHKDAGAQATVFAGGRYDNLVEELGGPKLSGIGFAIGLERLLILAESEDVLAEEEEILDAYIIDMTKGSDYAFKVAQLLRNNFYSCELNFYDRSMKSQFKSTERKHAESVFIIGEDEMNNNTVTIKNNNTKEQKTIKYSEIIDEMSKIEEAYE